MNKNFNENTIEIWGDIFQESQREFRKILEYLVEFRGYENIVIDLSNLKSCFSETILPYLCLIDKYKSEGVQFSVIPPKDKPLLKTFISSGWLKIIDGSKFKSSDERNDVLPARFFRNGDEQYKLVNEIIERILKTTNFLDREQLKALEWALNEVMDNVITHSGNELGGLVQLSHMKRSKEIEFVVNDCGIGIPNTLRSGLGVDWDDRIALEKSIQEGITRGTGQGNGLFGSYRISKESNGAFTINSGYAILALTRDGSTKLKEDKNTSIGTSVRCTINYSRPLVLEKALLFNGKSYNPTDYLDNQYEDDARLKIRDELISTGNRNSGLNLRKKAMNLSNILEKKIIIDCMDCSLMSSSFADELFAKLLEQYGLNIFKEKFDVFGISKINYEIANRSCIQRCGYSLPL